MCEATGRVSKQWAWRIVMPTVCGLPFRVMYVGCVLRCQVVCGHAHRKVLY